MNNLDTKIGERIKKIREHFGFNQTELGEIIGISQSAIGLYENGKRAIQEPVKKSICRELNIDYLWLTEGIGDMLANLPDTIFEELCIEYDLDDLDTCIIKEYLKLDSEQRLIIKTYLNNVFCKKK